MNGIIVSNGFGQFHLRGLAESLELSGDLSLFITGGLPPRWLRRLPFISGKGPVGRLVAREVQVDDRRVHPIWSAEVSNQLAPLWAAKGRHAAADRLYAASLDQYARQASRAVRNSNATHGVYHYRSGFGGPSLDSARGRDLALLCDHSIVAPGVIDRYVAQAPPTHIMPLFWSRMQRDIERADRVLVNSHFVAETMQEAGIPAERISVAYTPVDRTFIAWLDMLETSRVGIPTVTFAGTAEYRKGVDTVVNTIRTLGVDRARWRIVGDWSHDARPWKERLPAGVETLPHVPRRQLAEILSRSDVFFFPSRAEGSARVVGEALAAGCYVVTTRMAGSVVRSGIDGVVLDDADDVPGFAAAITEFLDKEPGVRTSAMQATKEFARSRLSSERYLRDVIAAYESVSR